MRTRKIIRAAELVALFFILWLPPHAAPADDDIGASCRVSFSGVRIAYDPMAAEPASSVGIVEIFCLGVRRQVVVTVDASTGSSGSYAQRTMHRKRESEPLFYNLYYDNSGAVFGDGRAGSQHFQRVIAANHGIAADAFRVELIVPPHQDVETGAYGDEISLDVEL